MKTLRTWNRIAGAILLLASLVGHWLSAQEDFQEKKVNTNITTEVLAFKSDSTGMERLDIYIQVPYPEISFVKEEDQYRGNYTLSATLQTLEKKELWQKTQAVEVRLKEFSQTISNQYSNLRRFSTDVVPGSYELILQIVDLESKKTTTLIKPVLVKDFWKDSLAMSSIMLVTKMDADSVRKSIVPNITGILLKETDKYIVFFEVYSRVLGDSVHLALTMVNTKQEIVAHRTKSEVLTGPRTQIIWKIDTLSIAAGDYIIMIEGVCMIKGNSAMQLQSSTSRTCFVRTKALPLSIKDIDKATDELIYIATGSEIDDIRNAATLEEKQKIFLAFWAKRDPNPKTPSNELMEEYYARVEYANKNFSHFMEGWKTDRGMVFIRFGAPQNIDRHPFDSDNKPYEIWYYYEENREFVFVDETGFGDYRLRYPTTDLWGRIR